MNSDRELLELAAKAAHVPGSWNDQYDCFWIKEGIRGPDDEPRRAREKIGISTESRIWWDPLADDGDALRLAVKLHIPFSSERATNATWICKGDLQVFEMHNGDSYAATRRAIVRAAAEIGRNMK